MEDRSDIKMIVVVWPKSASALRHRQVEPEHDATCVTEHCSHPTTTSCPTMGSFFCNETRPQVRYESQDPDDPPSRPWGVLLVISGTPGRPSEWRESEEAHKL